ncbi:MAG: site-2 protease family protein [Geothrix sp.]|uniref:site-2 protease family protein n=1 Tax=Geothrix sp. TaxID=1962974 RepID=UPI0017B6AB23|nr:site-2 protease family protein [Geothrix sp.]NWJ39847.1 site-2 protease family protein [Geothrix sp.]WIL22140.1 MAG: site-2 protease family protein [Geothrix sp.]
MFDSISIPTILVSYVALLFSLSVHEASHATVAYWLEDDTAARLGRMTLNPLAHIDPLGTVVFPLLGMATGFPFIGWAKPVPVDPRNLTRRFTQRGGMAIVSAAGPASNLVLAVIFLSLLLILVKLVAPPRELELRLFVHALFARKVENLQALELGTGMTLALAMTGRLVLINIGLALFNLLPMGPLDGSGILRGLLPWRWLPKYDRVQPWMGGALIVLALTGLLGYVIGPVFGLILSGIEAVARVFLGA